MDSCEERKNHVVKQLRLVFRAVQAHGKAVERQCGLSGAKLWMLWELGKSPGLKVSELARALAIHPSTCSNMLDQLEDRGLVRRDRSRTDQRAVHLHLTDQGQELVSQAPGPPQGALTEALGRLDDSTLTKLDACLEQLIAAMLVKDGKAALVPISGS